MSTNSERNHGLLNFERDARDNGFSVIAGVDEAGRGPLAGPVVAGAVVLGTGIPDGLDDSKKLTERRREALFTALHTGGHSIGVGVVTPEEIDELGIQPSNYRAMALAVENLPKVPDFLLIDGFQLPGVVQPQLRIVKGDQRSLSIAAASIIAKVTRDRMMYTLEETYPGYGFAKHKGYGTRAHLDAIERLGPCPAHRFSFAPLSRTAETRPLFE